MSAEDIACPFCGGKTRLVAESVGSGFRKQRRRCIECGSPFLSHVKDEQRPKCEVPCPERHRCLDVERPEHCPLYRMSKRSLKVRK